jgi:2-phosphoglycolate phosphatase
MPKNFPLQAIFFDLDGTLLDTAPDLAHALNFLLTKYQQPTLSIEKIRPLITEGSPGLLCHGFQISLVDPLFKTLRTEFLAVYRECLNQKTQFFPGIENVLSYLDQQKIIWGIVTNKPGWLTEPLMTYFNLTHRYRCLVSGDTLAQYKPAPEPLWHACALASVTPQHCVYIGDAESDVRAAKAAGLLSMVAKYGYIAPHHNPEHWQADYLIDTPEDILRWLSQ